LVLLIILFFREISEERTVSIFKHHESVDITRQTSERIQVESIVAIEFKKQNKAKKHYRYLTSKSDYVVIICASSLSLSTIYSFLWLIPQSMGNLDVGSDTRLLFSYFGVVGGLLIAWTLKISGRFKITTVVCTFILVVLHTLFLLIV
jgi:hypothetical protein